MAKVNLMKSYSRVLESLSELFQESGVEPSFVVPYVEGHNMSEHINAVGVVTQQNGGTGENFLLSYHKADGKGYGSADGETAGYPVSKLSQEEIKQNDPQAKEVLANAKTLLNQIESLLGEDDDSVVRAKSALSMAEASDAVGMTLFHLGVMIVHLLLPPIQSVAREHSKVKSIHAGRHPHSPELTAAMPNLPSGEESEESEGNEQASATPAPQPSTAVQAQ